MCVCMLTPVRSRSLEKFYRWKLAWRTLRALPENVSLRFTKSRKYHELGLKPWKITCVLTSDFRKSKKYLESAENRREALLHDYKQLCFDFPEGSQKKSPEKKVWVKTLKKNLCLNTDFEKLKSTWNRLKIAGRLYYMITSNFALIFRKEVKKSLLRKKFGLKPWKKICV